MNPWALFKEWDPYPLIRPFLFCLDPEVAHELVVKGMALGVGPRLEFGDDPILRTNMMGLDFSNPVGLGAGLDKQATSIDGFMRLGFGTIEVGTVTPKPQPGNPRPRMFRVPGDKGLINRFGFNSVGSDVFAERMAAWRAKPTRTRNPVGINLGKNKETEDDVVDYLAGFEKLYSFADYVTINVSSPNTPGLRDLQGRERMARLIGKVTEARARLAPKLPVLVKIAPDLTESQQDDIVAVALQSDIQGLIISNTTLARPASIPPELAKEAGGLSGPLLFAPSTKLLASVYARMDGKMPLIGCGGISTGADAYAKIRAGATMVQVYTALVYEGPFAINKIKRELAALLRRDGFASVADAVGADHRAR